MTDMAVSGPEMVARDIMQGLTTGRFAPGQRLAEPDLMARYAVGRSTVREALGRLVAAGVVEVVPHRGAAIRRLTRREAADVLRVAASLLALTARQAAEAVAAGADPGPLVEALEGQGDPGRGRARYYRRLATLAGNTELMRLMPAMQVPLLRAQLAGHLPDGAADHAAMVVAIVAGTPDAAAGRALAYLGRLLAALDAVPGAGFAACD